MPVLHVTGSDFEREVLQSELPVLVDFWAEWCGPCRMVSPIVDDIAQDLEGRLKVAKVNVDQAPDLAGKYQIMSIPTLLVIKGGKVVEQIVGAASKDHLLSKIKPTL